MHRIAFSILSAAAGLLAVGSPANAQFSTSATQPTCGGGAVTLNCSNFAPLDGGIIMGWNPNFDVHDTIADAMARMEFPASMAPGAFGMFIKISDKLIGQTPLETRKEDLDNMLPQIKGTNALLVVSLDPTEGYAAVTDAAIELFATKMQEFNSFGIPVLVRPAHEMNGPWYMYGQQPTAFIAFYRKVYSAVKAKAPYVKFIFAPNLGVGYPWPTGYNYSMPANSPDLPVADTNNNGQLDTGDNPYTPYWPGDDVVDWFGVSVYWKGTYPYGSNEAVPANYISTQLRTVVGGGATTYAFAESRGLPIIFAEGAGSYCATNPGVTNLETKRGFWQQIFSPAARASIPQLKMVLWFDYVKLEDNAIRDFSLSNVSSLSVGATFKADLATYPQVVYAGNLTLSDSSACGCFKYNAAGTVLNVTGTVKNATMTIGTAVSVSSTMPTVTTTIVSTSTGTAKSGAVRNSAWAVWGLVVAGVVARFAQGHALS